MRLILALMLLCFSISLAGCGESKPDPRSRPDFVDTSDPSAVPAPDAATGAEGGAGPAAPKQ
jgi:hypothetical protein